MYLQVWSAYTSGIKKKIARNLASLSDLDSGKFAPLNAWEEEVNQLLGIESAILVGLKYSDMKLPNYDSEDGVIVSDASSTEDIYSLDDFQKRKENSTEVAAKAVKLYDLQIEMLKKELHSLANVAKKKPDVVPPSTNSSAISSPQSPIPDDNIQLKIEFEDVEVPCSSAYISNIRKHSSDNSEQERSMGKKRKLTEKEKIDINCVTDYGGKVKTEFIGENEKVLNTKCSTTKGIFIIDTAIPPPLAPMPSPPPTHTIDMALSPMPPLAPAPTLPTLKKNLQFIPVAGQPPTLQPRPNLCKRKLDATKNSDLRENHSCSHETILINISNALQEIQQTNYNLSYYLEKLSATEEKKISLMEDANKEQKRHHQQIEKMAKVSLK